MNNMINYALNEHRTFEEKSFTEIDSLILSWLAYYHYPAGAPGVMTSEGIRLGDLWRGEYFKELLHGVLYPEASMNLLGAVTSSPRFRDLLVSNYVSDFDPTCDKQFSAVTFHLSPQMIYLAYRGTDSTFTGWKEDLNLSLAEPVPSQKESVSYLTNVASDYTGAVLVGGHSKGGNLAVYASAYCPESIQRRILRIFSHDGPGFSEEELNSEGFRNIHSRIAKTLPQSSLVGMLMAQEAQYTVIKSNDKGIQQHNPFTWEVEEDHFVSGIQLTKEAHVIYRSVNSWLNNIPEDDRVVFIDTVFDILEATTADSFDDFSTNLRSKLLAAIKEAWGLDTETKKLLLHLLADLATISAKNVPKVLVPGKQASEKQVSEKPVTET